MRLSVHIIGDVTIEFWRRGTMYIILCNGELQFSDPDLAYHELESLIRRHTWERMSS